MNEEISTPAVAPEPTPEVVASVQIPEPTPAPIFVPEPVAVAPAPEPEPAPVEMPKSKNDAPAASKLSASKKVVRLSKLIFEAPERNSASVGLFQFRLVERGFADAGSDKYGWLSKGTKKAFAEFAGVKEDKVNLQDAVLVKRLFEGTSVEVVE